MARWRFTLTRTITPPGGFDFAAGYYLGDLTVSSGVEALVGAGNLSSPVGALYLQSAADSTIWTFTTSGNDYPMRALVDDVNLDGVKEVIVGFRLINPYVYSLNAVTGAQNWQYTPGAGYVRAIATANMTGAAGKEIFCGNSTSDIALLTAAGAEIVKTTLPGTPFNPQQCQKAVITDGNNDGTNEIYLARYINVYQLDAALGIGWTTGLVPTGDGSVSAFGLDHGRFMPFSSGRQIAASVGRGTTSQQNQIAMLDSSGAKQWTKYHHTNVWELTTINVAGLGDCMLVGYGSHDTAAPPFTDLTAGVSLFTGGGLHLAALHLPASTKMITVGSNGEIVVSCDDGSIQVHTFGYS